MRGKVAVSFASAALSLLCAMPAYADVLPSFPDPSAPETRPLLLVGLVFVVVVSGTSVLLLRRIQRARNHQADSAEAAEPSAGDPSGDSESGHEA